jgi:hypothetical protein
VRRNIRGRDYDVDVVGAAIHRVSRPCSKSALFLNRALDNLPLRRIKTYDRISHRECGKTMEPLVGLMPHAIAIDSAPRITREPGSVRHPSEEKRQRFGSVNRTRFVPHTPNTYMGTLLAILANVPTVTSPGRESTNANRCFRAVADGRRARGTPVESPGSRRGLHDRTVAPPPSLVTPPLALRLLRSPPHRSRRPPRPSRPLRSHGTPPLASRLRRPPSPRDLAS